MAKILSRLSAATLALVLVFAAPQAWSISLSEKASLQAAMQRHIR
jgi:hypothetical protein